MNHPSQLCGRASSSSPTGGLVAIMDRLRMTTDEGINATLES